LAALLRRIAEQQGLQPGVHPGFARLRSTGRPQGPSSVRQPGRRS
jgi:hypothetical protein